MSRLLRKLKQPGLNPPDVMPEMETAESPDIELDVLGRELQAPSDLGTGDRRRRKRQLDGEEI